MIQNQDRPKRVAHIRTREQGEETAVFNILTAQYAILNGTGREIFQRCDGEHTIEAITQEICALCKEPPPEDEVLKDTLELVEELRTNGLVEIAGEAAASSDVTR